MILKLKLLDVHLSVVKLNQLIDLERYSKSSAFLSFTQTKHEISLVIESRLIEKDWHANTGWKAMEVEGPLDFSMVGVLSNILSPLADAAVSVFTISTFDTDYILVKEDQLALAMEVLGKKEGMEFL